MSNRQTRQDDREVDGEQPNVGTDPMEPTQNEPRKEIVEPDPQKVRQHEREEAEERRHETPAKHAERIKNA